MAQPREVLVTGATGAQGGAVAHALLDRGHRVRAYVRNPRSPAAAALQERGARLAVGDFDDAAALRAAAAGADAAYVMGTPWEVGAAGEIRQTNRIVDAAVAAGVQHVIYSSAANADRDTGIAWYDSKRRVERRLEALDVTWTVVAPAVFMHVVAAAHALAGLRRGRLPMALPPDRVQTWVDVADIGAFTALVVERPAEFAGRRIDIASQRLPGAAVAEVLSRATGRRIDFERVPLAQIRAFNENVAEMYEWFGRVGMDVDVAGLHAAYPEVGWHTFAEWAAGYDWSVLDAAAPARW
jgi:uncharacterized protein YbjT (DUF2867 family)